MLAIGDLHYRDTNGIETDKLLDELRPMFSQVDLVVVLGDVCHDFSRANLRAYDRAIKFLMAIQASGVELVVIIGNHDRASNRVFMTDEHFFNSLKLWERTRVVDTVAYHNFGPSLGLKFVFVPYVAPGSFPKLDLSDVSCVFCHQEWKGAKMGAITSNSPDVWEPNWPLCISGHIHDYAELGQNLIYVGSPLQHGYSEHGNKSVSLLEFADRAATHKRIMLTPAVIKRSLTQSLDEYLAFTWPTQGMLRIRVVGASSRKNEFLARPTPAHVKAVFVATDPKQVFEQKSFAERLTQAISQEPEHVRSMFAQLFAQT